ncbi:hypothetical protein JCM1840_003237 [Sporobolomyces johnsonii]
MERWTALLPDRAPTTATAHKVKLIGRLPEEAYIVILQYLPVPDIPQLALCSRKLAALARDDRLWRIKLAWLDYKGPGALNWRDKADDRRAVNGHDDETSAAPTKPPEPSRTASPVFSASDDEFGDFFEGEPPEAGPSTGGAAADDGFGDFQDGALDHSPDPFGLADDFSQVAIGSKPSAPAGKAKAATDDLLLMFDDETDFPAPPPTTKPRRPPAVTQLTFETAPPVPSPGTSRPAAFTFNPSSTPTSPHSSPTLLNVYKTHHSLLLPYYSSLITHTTSSLVFTTSTLTPMMRARLLASLSRFGHPLVAPTRSLPQRLTVLRNVQSATDFFESALLAEFEKADTGRDEKAMRDKAVVLWELNESSSLSQIFVQKREIFYDQGHNPLKNLTKIDTPSGGQADGIDFSAMDAYMRSILAVLSREGSLIARVFPPEADVLLYFLERIANDVVSDYITTLLSAAQPLEHPLFLLATAATFGQVYRLVEVVLEIEPKSPLVTKERAEDVVFKMFEPLMDDYLSEEGEWIREVLEGMCAEWDEKTASDLAVSDPTFLASQNPAQVKKNVLAGFTKVLLLPVTIIPKTATYGLNAITYGATGALNTFASLGTQLGGAVTFNSRTTPTPSPSAPEAPSFSAAPIEADEAAWGGATDGTAARLSIDANGTVGIVEPSTPTAPTPSPRSAAVGSRFDRMQLLLSLDTALQLIQADRDSLKRIQTFSRYPGLYGRKVRDAIEEVFIILLQVLGEKHVCPAFAKATAQMGAYRPEEHEGEVAVAPLVQFFELVHIGDTIQQMVDVYFDKEMAGYIDKKDFLNTVVREKKKFESSLDDAVAQGLNAAVNILMDHVEHVVTSQQGARDFAPDESADLDLRPTKACRDVIETLRKHCDMLKGSTDKQILEVFTQEVGIRLHGILLKHLKRLIVSTMGGLQLIADLNAYHAFVTTLRLPQVTAYFTSLKMVGEIYLVDSPKDLGALVRDTSRYEGTLSPDDLYELVQRRADWKKIDKQVEKQLFGLKLADDCVVS